MKLLGFEIKRIKKKSRIDIIEENIRELALQQKKIIDLIEKNGN